MVNLCPTCKFYEAHPSSGSGKTGICHRYPRQYSNGYYNFVQVDKSDWCGEWIANEEYLKSQYMEK